MYSHWPVDYISLKLCSSLSTKWTMFVSSANVSIHHTFKCRLWITNRKDQTQVLWNITGNSLGHKKHSSTITLCFLFHGQFWIKYVSFCDIWALMLLNIQAWWELFKNHICVSLSIHNLLRKCVGLMKKCCFDTPLIFRFEVLRPVYCNHSSQSPSHLIGLASSRPRTLHRVNPCAVAIPFTSFPSL